MTTNTDIVNRALQAFGSRTTVTNAELAANSSNEAIQANLVLGSTRDQLLRMAPWDCALNTNNLTYITSVPGTPENTSAATNLWTKGQPPPPWAYEYQYPVDCLRACWMITSSQIGTTTGVPITTAVTGGAAVNWTPPIRYKVQIDQFYPVTAAAIVAGGLGYAIGDLLTLAGTVSGSAPIGAPVQLLVATIGGGGAILTASVVNQIIGSATPQGGSYFAVQANPIAVASVAGVGGGVSAGAGATFNLTFGAQGSQRVILTNEEFATLAYVKQVTDPNIMDPLFIDAWIQVLAAYINFGLAGDKALSNICIGRANNMIIEARKVDGNEGLTVNDVTPDFIRIRGIAYTEDYSGPYSQGFDWGPSFASF